MSGMRMRVLFDDAPLRARAWTALAVVAEQREDSQAAAQAWRPKSPHWPATYRCRPRLKGWASACC